MLTPEDTPLFAHEYIFIVESVRCTCYSGSLVHSAGDVSAIFISRETIVVRDKRNIRLRRYSPTFETNLPTGFLAERNVSRAGAASSYLSKNISSSGSEKKIFYPRNIAEWIPGGSFRSNFRQTPLKSFPRLRGRLESRDSEIPDSRHAVYIGFDSYRGERDESMLPGLVNLFGREMTRKM